MTLRQLLEGVQIELTTHNTGVLLLEDFNYVSNKAVYQIIIYMILISKLQTI